MVPFDPSSINQIRLELGCSQRESADKIGVPHVTVYRWERGISHPNADHLGRVYDVATESDLIPAFFSKKRFGT